MIPQRSTQHIAAFLLLAISFPLFARLSLAQTARSPATDPKRWAILIGVSDYEYPYISNGFGGNDILLLQAVLTTSCGFAPDHVIVLTSGLDERRLPRRQTIFNTLAGLVGRIPEDGLLLVAFAGHGISRDRKTFLLPSDATNSGDVDFLEETAISVDKLRAKLK